MKSSRFAQLTSSQRNVAIYFTAGYPKLGDTLSICVELQKAGVSLIEIGVPFSDPVADGPTIQASSQKALDNGMSLSILFEQLSDLRRQVSVPVVLMGYLNPILQYGPKRFAQKCNEIGIDGTIIPDLPLSEYRRDFKNHYKSFDIEPIFLVAPDTSPKRIREFDQESDSYIYAISKASVTGGTQNFPDAKTVDYLNQLQSLKLKNPVLVGFGISTSHDVTRACELCQGAIIGSAFIRALEAGGNLGERVQKFMYSIDVVSR
jgi:tryptophan synthase alpha chain